MTKHTLEPTAQQITEATSKPPFPDELGPDGAPNVLDDIQAARVARPDIEVAWTTVPAEADDVPVRIVKPAGAAGTLPTVLCVRGGGGILGNAGPHDLLVRELRASAVRRADRYLPVAPDLTAGWAER